MVTKMGILMALLVFLMHTSFEIEAFAVAASPRKPVSATSLYSESQKQITRESDTELEKTSDAALKGSTQDMKLTEDELDFTRGYLNKHHASTLLVALVTTLSELGVVQAKKNSWSGGSYKITSAELKDIARSENMEWELQFDVTVDERGKASRVESVSIGVDSAPLSTKRTMYADMPPIRPDIMVVDPCMTPLDDLLRRMCRLCWIVGQQEVTGKLVQVGIQLARKRNGDTGGESQAVGEIKDNLYLNQVPHNRFVRNYFYDLAADATLQAVSLCSKGELTNRMKLTAMFPEMNPSMDAYRIGTILELVRTVIFRLVEQNLRVRVCVQGSMGVGIFTGVPKQLNGVNKLLQMMDWQSGPGEANEGLLGNYLNFGAIGKDHVVNAHTAEDGTKVEQDDVFILIAPQSMVGVESSIMPNLVAMVEAAGDRPVLLINPDLTDKVSSQGQQNIRGRQDRLDFSNSFHSVFHFSNLYVSGTSYFPILGSMTRFTPLGPWIAHQRRDLAGSGGGEVYVPILAAEHHPDGEVLMKTIER